MYKIRNISLLKIRNIYCYSSNTLTQFRTITDVWKINIKRIETRNKNALFPQERKQQLAERQLLLKSEVLRPFLNVQSAKFSTSSVLKQSGDSSGGPCKITPCKPKESNKSKGYGCKSEKKENPCKTETKTDGPCKVNPCKPKENKGCP